MTWLFFISFRNWAIFIPWAVFYSVIVDLSFLYISFYKTAAPPFRVPCYALYSFTWLPERIPFPHVWHPVASIALPVWGCLWTGNTSEVLQPPTRRVVGCLHNPDSQDQLKKKRKKKEFKMTICSVINDAATRYYLMKSGRVFSLNKVRVYFSAAWAVPLSTEISFSTAM